MTEQNHSDSTPHRNRFVLTRRMPVRVSKGSLVRIERLSPDDSLPVLVQPALDDINLAAWAANERRFIEGQLFEHGALLFRGFGGPSLARFEAFARAASDELLEYGERSSPRSRLGDGIYTSTDHPSEQPILLHSEQSYTLRWPMKVFFHCLRSPAEGGETPIADTRRIYRRLSAATLERVTAKQIRYVRNYGMGLGLSWQDVFQTSERASVEEYCRRSRIEFEWIGRDGLRTHQVRPAIRIHPGTREPVWFNHAVFFHLSSLEPAARDSMLSVISQDEVPFNTFYGDGTAIEQSLLDEVREAYAQETKRFSWQEGDILLLDNMLVAHGRRPFSGPRKIAAAFADPFAAD